MAQLNYHHLRYFRAIAHEGSLTGAAAQLHVSPSALSVQLGKLEEQLGHRLFERQGKRLVLTEAGRMALDCADAVHDAGEELLNTLRGEAAAAQALRIGALTTLSRNFQVQFLKPLLGRDDVELVVRAGTLRELVADLEAHRLDVVLSNVTVRRDAATTLHAHLLDEQRVALVSRPRGSGKAPKLRFPDDLRGAPVLLPSLDSDVRVAFDRSLALAGVRPRIVAEVDDMAMLRVLARESGALTLVPTIVVRDELEAGTLVERCSVPDVVERFYAIVQQRRFPNPLLATLLDPRGTQTPGRTARNRI
jgi:LysR family transcriptional activator of nhaA